MANGDNVERGMPVCALRLGAEIEAVEGESEVIHKEKDDVLQNALGETRNKNTGSSAFRVESYGVSRL